MVGGTIVDCTVVCGAAVDELTYYCTATIDQLCPFLYLVRDDFHIKCYQLAKTISMDFSKFLNLIFVLLV